MRRAHGDCESIRKTLKICTILAPTLRVGVYTNFCYDTDLVMNIQAWYAFPRRAWEREDSADTHFNTFTVSVRTAHATIMAKSYFVQTTVAA